MSRARFAIAEELSMTSKKSANSKRATLPRSSDRTKSFSKDWERLSHSGRYDMRQLKVAMMLLIANDEPMGLEWLDHPLTGDWPIIAIGGSFTS